ncbi:hypothetical protein [Effusibacillus pohliae]|uniref:hypothetical protein n=1 Tax=Effusibacillus pohliae TaxID=232270 RepID=UPI0003616FF1|nr:hypothetical protein [Effusibacillus pohliae]
MQNWVYAAAVLGCLQLAEILYNRFQFKLAGELVALCSFAIAAIWLGASGWKLLRKERSI